MRTSAGRRCGSARRSPGYQSSLTTEDIAQIEKVAGRELRGLGYAP
ncbi:MAG TPA: hypothetical protein VFW50_31975 [Streptosporangiaceae bacterium]|nr:hypothetical protein [Streptosporangiaceae bacterium]